MGAEGYGLEASWQTETAAGDRRLPPVYNPEKELDASRIKLLLQAGEMRRALNNLKTSTTLSGRFSRGVAWATIGTALSQGIGLLVSIFCARMLGKVHFGEFGIIQSTIGLYGVFAGLWLGLGATKFVAEFKSEAPDRAGRIIGLSFMIAIISSLAVSMVLIATAPYLAQHVLNAPHLSTELAFVAGIIVLNVLDGVQVGVLSGFEAFGAIARTSIIRSMVALPITVALVWQWGLSGAVGSLAVIGFLNLWINHLALRVQCRKFKVLICWRSTREELWSFVNFSTPAVCGGLLGAPVLWVANSMLVNTPSGYAQMGIYAIASQWRNAVMFLPRRFISVALPIMSAEENKSDEDSRCREVFELTQRLSIAIVVPLVTLLLFSSHWVVKVYGESYNDARLALMGMLLTTGITGFGAGGGADSAGKGQNVVWIRDQSNLVDHFSRSGEALRS